MWNLALPTAMTEFKKDSTETSDSRDVDRYRNYRDLVSIY